MFKDKKQSFSVSSCVFVVYPTLRCLLTKQRWHAAKFGQIQTIQFIKIRKQPPSDKIAYS